MHNITNLKATTYESNLYFEIPMETTYTSSRYRGSTVLFLLKEMCSKPGYISPVCDTDVVQIVILLNK